MEDIILEKVSKSYQEKKVLDQVSFQIPAGKVTALLAPSGKGKTTLLRILMGLEQMEEGRITGLEGIKKSVVFQEDRLCENLGTSANIRLTAPWLSSEEVRTAMERVGLMADEKQPVREFSGGMKRRVALLRALLARWEILFLDEPFKGLDSETKESVMNYTAEFCRGKTVLLVTHEKEEAAALGAEQFFQL